MFKYLFPLLCFVSLTSCNRTNPSPANSNPTPPTEAPKKEKEPLSIALQVEVKGVEVHGVLVFTNVSSSPAWLVKWDSVFDGKFGNDVFRIKTKDTKEEVHYKLPMSKRMGPTDKDFLRLDPGQKYETRFRLDEAYQFLPGHHSYEGHYEACFVEPESVPTHRVYCLSSNAVTFEVTVPLEIKLQVKVKGKEVHGTLQFINRSQDVPLWLTKQNLAQGQVENDDFVTKGKYLLPSKPIDPKKTPQIELASGKTIETHFRLDQAYQFVPGQHYYVQYDACPGNSKTAFAYYCAKSNTADFIIAK